MSKILLITKLKTTNIGNQALSDEMIRVYENAGTPFQVTGRPEGLFGYSLEKLAHSKNPVEKFEGWADQLIRRLDKYRHEGKFQEKTRRVELLSFDDFKVRNDSFFQMVKNIFRKYIHSDALFASRYKKRFQTIAATDVIVYSGAGEVGDNNIFLRQLLELRVAQKMGKRTFAINQSVEVMEMPLKDLCAHVYGKMEGIIVRGTVSKSKMEELNIPAAKIQCFPDSAFLNPTPDAAAILKMKQQYTIQQPSVGINVTKVADDMTKWSGIIDLIKSLGYTIYFISNDPFGDKAIGEKLAAKFDVKPILDFMHYSDYAALIANFDFVISCRLHTNELSLTGGTPVIPIEGSHFKTREVFSFVNYPIPVTSSLSPDWDKSIKTNIQALHANAGPVNEFIKNLDQVRNLSLRNRVG